MKKGIILCLLLLGINAFSQSSEAKLKELITLTKSDQMMAVGFQQFMDYYNNKYKDLPDHFWDEFKKDMSADQIFTLYIPVYKKYFTDADIDELIKFYKTPTGRKLIENMPNLLKDSVETGTKYVKALDERVKDKLNKHYHFQDPPPLPPGR